MIYRWLVDKLIAFAKRTPYSHLHNPDGSVYMERYWLIPYSWKLPFAIRLHWIAGPDKDRYLHDHPWTFLSFILRGWYIEERPVSNAKCFYGNDFELTYRTVRKQGSLALRRATDRHRISYVWPGGAWTLFISFTYRHWWGFYAPFGKIYWQDYNSIHTAIGEVPSHNSEASQHVHT